MCCRSALRKPPESDDCSMPCTASFLVCSSAPVTVIRFTGRLSSATQACVPAADTSTTAASTNSRPHHGDGPRDALAFARRGVAPRVARAEGFAADRAPRRTRPAEAATLSSPFDIATLQAERYDALYQGRQVVTCGCGRHRYKAVRGHAGDRVYLQRIERAVAITHQVNAAPDSAAERAKRAQTELRQRRLFVGIQAAGTVI